MEDKMTRKRFIKLAMAEGMDKNEAVFAAKCCIERYGSYYKAYKELLGIIRFRFEPYMLGYEKRINKRIKKQCC